MQIYTNDYTELQLDDHNQYVIVDVFNTWKGYRKITLGESSKLTYLCICSGSISVDIDISSIWKESEANIKGLILWEEEWKLFLKCHSNLLNDYATSNIHLVSFLKNWSNCEIDWWVNLHKNVKKVEGHLLEENIVLGEDIRIKTLPMLDVHSSDVAASHGARIQKLSEEKLFYLRSRGLEKKESERLMLEGYVTELFSQVDSQENEEIDNLKRFCLEVILR